MGEDKELELFVTYPNGEEKPLDKGSLSCTIYLDCSRVGKSIELLREAVFSLAPFNYEISRFLEGKMTHEYINEFVKTFGNYSN